MNIKDTVKQIKTLLSQAKTLADSVKLSQERLSDDSLIQYKGESITLTQDIFLVSGAGVFNPLPDGEYITKAEARFTVKDGKVASVSGVKVPEQAKPVLQAQSAQEEVTEVTEEVAAEQTEEVKPAEEVALADAGVTVDINTVISAALSPVWDAIYAIQDSISNLTNLYVSQDQFSKVNQAMSAITEVVSDMGNTVEVLAKEPAGKPVEKEVNGFRPVPQEFTETKLYKVFKA